MEIYISNSIPLMYFGMCYFKFTKNKQYCINGGSARASEVRLNFLILKGIGSTAGTVLAPRIVSVKSAVDFKTLSVDSNTSMFLFCGFSFFSIHKPRETF